MQQQTNQQTQTNPMQQNSAAPQTPPPSQQPSPQQPNKKNRRRLYIAIIIAILVIALLFWLFYHGNSSANSSSSTTINSLKNVSMSGQKNSSASKAYPYLTLLQVSKVSGYNATYSAQGPIQVSELIAGSNVAYNAILNNSDVSSGYSLNYSHRSQSNYSSNQQILEWVVNTTQPRLIYSDLLGYANGYNPLNATYDGMLYSISGIQTSNSTVLEMFAWKGDYVAIITIIDNHPINTTLLVYSVANDLTGAAGSSGSSNNSTGLQNSTSISNLVQCSNFTVVIPSGKNSATGACFWKGGNLSISSNNGPNSTLSYSFSTFNSSNESIVSSFVQFNSISNICNTKAQSRYFSKSDYLLQIRIYGQAYSAKCGLPSTELLPK